LVFTRKGRNSFLSDNIFLKKVFHFFQIVIKSVGKKWLFWFAKRWFCVSGKTKCAKCVSAKIELKKCAVGKIKNIER